jgi:hypothetical protein
LIKLKRANIYSKIGKAINFSKKKEGLKGRIKRKD